MNIVKHAAANIRFFNI